MPRSWEGNRRSGVALAMGHGLSGLSTYRLNGHRKGDEHPAYTPEAHDTLYLYLLLHTHCDKLATYSLMHQLTMNVTVNAVINTSRSLLQCL